jgi:hypothetical protein
LREWKVEIPEWADDRGCYGAVWAKTRGKARSLGAAELGWDYPIALRLRVTLAK